MYIHLWQNSRGIPKKWLYIFFFLENIDGSDKTIHKAFRIHKTLETKLIREIFLFFMYQNYTLALNLKNAQNIKTI